LSLSVGVQVRLCVAAMVALVVSVAATSAALAATVTNGGFESGTFSGWTVVNRAGSSGTWYVYAGTHTPLTNTTVAAPPEGTHAAVTDQNGPGTHQLYQDITLAAGFTHTLTFSLYYRSNAAFTAPGPLNHVGGANQQYRVDIMKTTAADFSIAAGDVLANVFQTQVGDPTTLAPTTKTFDLTPYAGQTIRFRVVEVDNRSNFRASVDNVQVTSVGAVLALSGSASPEPVATGSTLTYVFTATNNGPDPASSAVLAQTLPAGTGFVSAVSSVGPCTTPAVGASGSINCALGTLANGATATLTVKATVSAAAGASLSSTANVSSATSDPVPGNNAAAVASTVVAAPVVASPTPSVVPMLPAAGSGPSPLPGLKLDKAGLLGLAIAVGLAFGAVLRWRPRARP
jgi:uncharacterized repeat protein (TIGR01451 family)